MIAQIRGCLVEKEPAKALIDVNGLVYEVDIPYTTFFQLPAPGETTLLHTHFVVREDAQALFGFLLKQDRDLFRQLIKVNGVGPKLALAILSGLDAHQFAKVVDRAEIATLVKLPGVGKKTAERLLIEMRDRMKSLGLADGLASSAVIQPQMPPKVDVIGEAESALIALGYRPQEASRAVAAVFREDLPSAEVIRQALRGMLRPS